MITVRIDASVIKNNEIKYFVPYGPNVLEGYLSVHILNGVIILTYSSQTIGTYGQIIFS